MACMKHFALNSMENARFTVDVRVDERALHEVYLPHFRRVAEAGVASVMSAYNQVNGEWCGENATLLRTILRDEWGWDGFVTSDFTFGVRDAVASVRGGLNIEMPFRMHRAVALPTAVADGTVDMAVVDDLVAETVATLLRFADRIAERPDADVVACPAHRALAHEAAVASMVLVRNDGTLPLAADDLRRVAVLGPLAAVANLGDQGSSNVTPPTVVTPLDGIRAALPHAEVVHADRDVTITAGADATIVVVGTTRFDEGEFLDQSGIAPLMASFPAMDDPVAGSRPMPSATRCSPGPREGGDGSADFTVGGGDRRSLRLSDERRGAGAIGLRGERPRGGVRDGRVGLRDALARRDRSHPHDLVPGHGGRPGAGRRAPRPPRTRRAAPLRRAPRRGRPGRLRPRRHRGHLRPVARPVEARRRRRGRPPAVRVRPRLHHLHRRRSGPVEDDSHSTDRIAVDVTNRGVPARVDRRAGLRLGSGQRVRASTAPARRLPKVHAEPGETRHRATSPLDRRQLDVRVDGAWVTEDLDVVLHVGQCAGDDVVTLTLPR